ncbi:Protein of unknown function, partial [Gryllus bimaculatus]
MTQAKFLPLVKCAKQINPGMMGVMMSSAQEIASGAPFKFCDKSKEPTWPLVDCISTHALKIFKKSPKLWKCLSSIGIDGQALKSDCDKCEATKKWSDDGCPENVVFADCVEFAERSKTLIANRFANMESFDMGKIKKILDDMKCENQ